MNRDRSLARVACAAAFSFALAGAASAAVVDTRADLNAALGASAVTENFDNWTGTYLLMRTLDATTTAYGPGTAPVLQGPNLVRPDVAFSNINYISTVNQVELDRGGNSGYGSGKLLAEGGILVIDFKAAAGVAAAGFDYTDLKDRTDRMTVTVYASNDTTVLYTSPLIDVSSTPWSAFFGYADAGGIGKVTVKSNSYTNGFSPSIDDLTYSAVPEPAGIAAWAVAGLALGRRARRATR